MAAPPPPAISIIIPAHNAARTIVPCLKALQNQTLAREQYEIIVVDDGSRDETGRIAADLGVQVIHQPQARAAAARNTGIAAARGELLCFTDADCEPFPDWLAQISAPFATDPELAGVKGIYASHQRQLTARFVQIEYEEKYDRLRGQPQIQFIDFYSAAFRRHVLVNNDGFDERFPNSEDRELSFRLATRGYKMQFVPDAVVAHWHADSLPAYMRKKFQNGYWTAQVVRRFPTHGVEDSYTPQVMKFQILLAALFLGLLALAPLSLWALAGSLAVLLVFSLTTITFTRRAWQRDRGVALAAPLLLGCRALSLGLGYAWGLARPLPDLERKTPRISGWRYLVKRGLDVVVGGAGVLLLTPLLSLRQWRRGGRPVFERRVCVGQHGDEKRLLSFADNNTWQAPWLWHVLRGDLSLIGPVPTEPDQVAAYEDWHRRRLAVKPGLIQPVTGAGGLSLDDRVRLELDYIEHYTLGRDGRILWRTLTGRQDAAAHE